MSAKGSTEPGSPRSRRPRLRFRSSTEHLEAWFSWIDLASGGADDATLSRHARSIDTAANEAKARGVNLPFADLAEAEGLDQLDRIVLLALLRSALELAGPGGLSVHELTRISRPRGLNTRLELREKLEGHSPLRRLGLLQSDVNPDCSARLYRLAPEAAESLADRPRHDEAVAAPTTADDALNRLMRAAQLVHLVDRLDETQCSAWATASSDGPGWDRLGVVRAELTELLTVLRTRNADPVGNVLVEAELDDLDATILALLASGPDGRPVALSAEFLLAAAIRRDQRGAKVEARLGTEGRLFRVGLVHFPSGPVPMPFRRIALTDAGRDRLRIPPEGALASTPRPIGFRRPSDLPNLAEDRALSRAA